MASIGNDRYLRYLLLVGQGGTITLRGILIRDIGSPLPDVLDHNRAKLKMKKNEMDRIFTENGISDINKWDIAILSKIILQLCRGKTPAEELDYIRILQSLRNELSHPGSLAINDDKEYVEQWRHAGCTLTKLSKNLDRSIRDECQNLIENCKSGLINRQETLHMLGSISQYDNKISEQLAILTRRVEELTEQVIIIMKEIEDLRQEVEQYILSERDAKCRTMAVLESRLTIRGDNTQLTELAEEILERVFRRASKRTQVPEDETQLISEVRQFLDEMEAHEGVYVCGIKKECIQVKIVFENFKGLLKLLEFFQSNEFRNRLHGLIKAMEEMNDSQYQITFEIDKDNVDSITKSMAKATNDEIQMAIAEDKLIELRTINAHQRRLETDETMLKQASDRPDVIGGNSDSSETELSPSETPGCDEELGLQRENEALLDDIVDIADVINDEDHVILLIGQIGAGKSSLINTLHKILTDRYFIVAPQGRGMTQSVTTELIRYDKCGATLSFLERIPNENKKQKMKKIFKKLPHIIDFAGFGNHNTPELTEILELLIGGYIPTGTTIQALENIQKFGIGALKGVFPDANPKLQVSKIFFLTSFTDAFPEKLIQCLNGVLTNYQSAGPYLKRKPDLYILATKYDLVLDQNLRSGDTSDESNKILEEFLKVEERLSSELKRNGRSFRWISFHDGINVNSTSVENMVLKVLKCIFEPGAPVLKYNKKVIGIRVRAKLGAYRVKQCLQKFLTEDVHIEVTRAMFLVGVACMVAVVLALWFIK
ncbi:uncharacterized protein LOC132714920 isoform X2 [Ruditapes philippinarum]|uniref:uncharacterized protein LOC132714920 isoform X2 n=1 Tax=Ruditapes philippinarum TaxID=129788 RepID=UPI00295A610D|nr:uncharacterized protein LOC132714920 isoform X2 [Ruditapes philippinarum]